jgi:hypothetical protein
MLGVPRAIHFRSGHELVEHMRVLADLFLEDPRGPVLGRLFAMGRKRFNERPLRRGRPLDWDDEEDESGVAA